VAVQLPVRVPSPPLPTILAASLIGNLWRASPGWLAARLLAITALCRGLQGTATNLRNTSAACAALTTLYTGLARPRASGGPDVACEPALPQPMLGVFVSAWSAAVPALRESAQVLLPASTEPLDIDPSAWELLSHAFGPPPPGCNHVVVPDAPVPLLLEVATSAHVAASPPGAGWDALPAADRDCARPRLLTATPLLAQDSIAYPGRVVLLPVDTLAILELPPGTHVDPIQVLLAACACAIHPKSVPPALVHATILQLADLAGSAPALHASAAAGLLSNMLHGPDAKHWLQHLLPMHALLDKLFSAFLTTHRALADQVRTNNRTASASQQHGCAEAGGCATQPIAWLQQLPQADRALVLLPELRVTHRPRNPHQTLTHPGHRKARVHPHQALYPPLPATRQAPTHAPVPDPKSVLSTTDLANNLDTLDALISECAAVDFSTFVHTFNNRIAVGQSIDAHAPTHISALKAANALLHTQAGRTTVLQHVAMLSEAMLRLLDPGCSGRRAECFPVLLRSRFRQQAHY
jgi:hypothetical protein